MLSCHSFAKWLRDFHVGLALRPDPIAVGEPAEIARRVTERNLAYENADWPTTVVRGPSVDAVLFSAALKGYRYLLLQSDGHYFRDRQRFISELTSAFKTDFLFYGHILDLGRQYFSVHHQCIFIDLTTWKDLGRPAFGDENTTRRQLHRPARSTENYHDAHTPLWIRATGEHSWYEAQGPGWNFVHRALEAGVGAHPYTEQMRSAKGHLYPDQPGNFYRKIAELERSSQNATHCLRPLRDLEIEAILRHTHGELDCIVSTANSFASVLASAHSRADGCRVLIYSDCRSLLDLWRWLLETWDGVEPLSLWEQCPQRDKLITSAKAALSQLTDMLGGSVEFSRLWSRYRKLEHVFQLADVFTSDVLGIVNWVNTVPTNGLVFWGDLFHSRFTHAALSEDRCYWSYSNWLRKWGRHPGLWGIGRDNNGALASGPMSALAPSKQGCPSNIYLPDELCEWFAEEITERLV